MTTSPQECSEETIGREAEAGVAGIQFAKILAALTWFPFDGLPRIHWNESGRAVTTQTATWWLMQAFKLKSPSPSALLRQQVLLVQEKERERFGVAVLQAWIDFDTMPRTLEEARIVAAKHYGCGSWERAVEYLQKVDKVPGNLPIMPALEDLTQQLAQLPGGSAISSKGLLAVPAACGGVEAVRLAAAYIRKWYGIRSAQSKALVRMISWIEHPEAVQFLTATSKRFRTTGIRNEAFAAVRDLAARKSWTVDELADRMIPDAGLDHGGRMSLDLGGRTFFAALDSDFSLRLHDANGKLREALPKPSENDDENLFAEAQRMFSASKKQIRVIVKEQADRLFGAMCSGRRWPLSLWRDALAARAVAGLLCRRLVWRAETHDGDRLFRPRGGGGLVDVAGNLVELPGNAAISLAHDDNTLPGQAFPWIAHLEEHAIDFLFPQFNRGLPEFRDEQLHATSIEDFEGYVLSGFQLRNAARKLGYFRGAALDGPQFFEYFKPYAVLRLEVRLEFSGNAMPEEDLPVAIERMTFHALPDPGQTSRGPLKLRDVPRVLLLESFRDLREIANTGKGYDEGWRERACPK